MDNLEHFAPAVPIELQLKLAGIAKELQQEYIADWSIHRREACGLARVNEISGVSFSGFIPFQNGGFEVTEYYANGWSSGSYFTNAECKFIDDSYEDMRAVFLAEYKTDTVDLAILEEYESYENEWSREMETLLRVYLVVERVDRYDDSSECSTVRVTLACNYKDAPYYREKHDECIKELTFSIEDFMLLTCDNLIKQLHDR